MRTWLLTAVIFACGGVFLPLIADEPAKPAPLTGDERKAIIAERDRLWAEAQKLDDQRQTSEAISRGQQVLAIERTVFGNDHFELTGTLVTLAGWHERLGEWAAARRDLTELLALRTALDSAQHWQAIDARLGLARLSLVEKLSADQQRRYLEAGKLIHDVESLSQQKKYREAIPVAERAAAIYAEVLGPNSQSFSDARYWLAFMNFQSGEYATAESLYREVAEFRQRLLGREHLDTVHCQKAFAQSLYHLKRYEEGAVLFAHVAKMFDQLEKPDTAAWMHSWLGDCQRDLKDDAAAIKAYTEAAELFDKLKLDAGIASTHHEAARALFRQKKFALALPHFQRAAQAFDAVGQGVDAAWMFIWQGYCQRDLADHAASTPLFAAAATQLEKLQSWSGLGEAEFQLGRALYRQKEYAQAIESLERSVVAYEKVAKGVDAACSVFWIGNCRRELGDQAAAAAAYADGTARFTTLKDNGGLIEALREWAKVQYRSEQYAEAAPRFEQAAALYDTLKQPTDAAWMLSWQGDCQRELKDDPAAIKLYQQCVARFTQLKNEDGVASNSFQLGKALVRLKRHAEALPHFQQAAASYEAIANPIDAAWMWSWFGDCQRDLKDDPAAMKAYQESLDRFTKLKHDGGIAENSRQLGKAFVRLGRKSEAVPHLIQAAKSYEAAGKTLDTADSLTRLGLAYTSLGDYPQAEETYLRALDLTRAAVGEEHADFAWTLSNLASLYKNMGRYTLAKPLQLQALEIRRKLFGDQSASFAKSLGQLSDLYVRMGHYVRAEQRCQQALDIRKKLYGEEHEDYASSLNTLANIALQRGDHQRAEALCWKGLEIRKKLVGERHEYYALSLNSLGLILESRGDYAGAEPLFRQCLEIIKEVRGVEHPEYANCLNCLAILYQELGDSARAEPLLVESLEIRKQSLGTSHPLYATALHNLAALYKSLGEYQRAKPLYEEAREILRRKLGTKHRDYAGCVDSLALLHSAMNDLSEAEKLFQETLQIYHTTCGPRHPDYARALNNLAGVYLARKEWGRAAVLYRQANEIWKRTFGEQNPTFATSLRNLALVKCRLGEIATAHALCRQAQRIERRHLDLTAAIQSERQQLAMLADMRFGLDGLVSLARRDPQLGAGTYEDVLAWKGFVLGQQRAIRAVADRPELAPLMDELRTTATQLATLSLATPAPEEAETWRAEVAELSQRKEDLEGKLSAASREYRGTRQPVELAAVRAALPPHGALVDFVQYLDTTSDLPFVRENASEILRYAAFVIPREGPITFLDLGSAFPVHHAVETWRKDQGRTKGAEQAARLLRERIWNPIEAHLAGIKTVLVCPDGDLSTFPLAALPGKEPGTFLLEEDRLLATIPAAQAIPELVSEQPGRHVQRNLLVLGAVDYDRQGAQEAEPEKKPKKNFRQLAAVRGDDTLQFVLHNGMKAEPGEIARKYQEVFGDDQFTLLEGGKASEETVRLESPRHLYLHFATHGFFAPPSVRSAMSRDAVDRSQFGGELVSSQSLAGYHPGLLSGIALAGANHPVPGADDGILTAEEVGTLNLTGVQLVVLSACETGLGQSAGGEGLLGLQRAFQAAGARTVVASLWKVPDAATRDLMERFYDNLWNKEMGKLAALREAQLWLLRERGGRGLDEVPAPNAQLKRLPPYYWAAFVLSGDWR